MSAISLEDFKKCELRVARIVDVQEIAGADRLWRLTVDVGVEKKEIVAGIKMFYPREALLGKSIVLLNNLTPVMLRGVQSNGMLLAAKDGDKLAILTLDKELSPGSMVS